MTLNNNIKNTTIKNSIIMGGIYIYCPKCGIENRNDDNFCSYCGEEIGNRNFKSINGGRKDSINNHNIIKDEIKPNYSGSFENNEFRLASLGSRILAYLVDMFVLIILIAIFTVPIFVIQYMYFTYDEPIFELVANLVGFLIVFSYFILMEGPLGKGRTIGKMALKLRVVKEKDHSRIGFGKSAIRNFLRIIDGFFLYLIGMLLISRSEKNQRLGDSVAKTIVITEKK